MVVLIAGALNVPCPLTQAYVWLINQKHDSRYLSLPPYIFVIYLKICIQRLILLYIFNFSKEWNTVS
jgi:hypothetical protein